MQLLLSQYKNSVNFVLNDDYFQIRQWPDKIAAGYGSCNNTGRPGIVENPRSYRNFGGAVCRTKMQALAALRCGMVLQSEFEF